MVSLGRNVIANIVGRVWVTLLGILFIPLYLKFVGIEAYGLVGFYATLQGVLGLLDLGIGSTLNREIARLSVASNAHSEQRDLVRTLEVLYWGLAIIGGSVIFILAPFITNTWIQAENLSSTTVLLSVRLMGLAIALQFPFSFYQGGLMGLQRQVLVNSILVITGTLRSVGSVLLLWLVSPTIEVFFVWQVIAGCIGSITFYVAMWYCLPKCTGFPRFRIDMLQNVWKYAAAISANALIGIVISQLDKIILSKMLPLKTFAYYTLALTVASAVWMIIIPINNAVFPRFVLFFEANKNEDLKRLFHLSSQLLIVVLIPISLILTIHAKEVLILWTKSTEIANNSSLIVILLVIGTTINGIASLSASAIMAFGHPQIITKTNLCQAFLIVPLITIAVKSFGMPGAAVVWIILNCAYMLIMAPIVITRYLKGEFLTWLFTDNIYPIVAMICIGFFLRHFLTVQTYQYLNLMNIGFTWFLVSIIGVLAAKDVRNYVSGIRFFK